MSAAVEQSAPVDVVKKPSKPKVQKQPPAHPKYIQMVHEAIAALKERGGSSRQAILKHIMANFNVGENETAVNSRLKLALKAGVKSSALRQSKGTGASGSFKLGEKPKVAKPKKKAPVKKDSKSKVKPARKSSSTSTTKKATAKKSKSNVKKPAAKRSSSSLKSKKSSKSVKRTPSKPKSRKPSVKRSSSSSKSKSKSSAKRRPSSGHKKSKSASRRY